MADIVIFGGTSEGRLLAEAFENTKINVQICVATEYGASLLPNGGNISIHTGRMDEAEIEVFLREQKPAYCLDATHPYAALVTQNVKLACEREGISYLRVERGKNDAERAQKDSAANGEAAREEQNAAFVSVKNAEQAAEFLKHTKGAILLTTGSKELEAFTVLPDFRERCFARVLPTVSVMEKCRELGFEGRNLIGMQGPFSEELNYAMLKQVGAAYLVTKNAGKEGGYQEKCEAALRAGVNLVVIERPEEEKGNEAGETFTLEEAISFLKETFAVHTKRKVYLVGIGTGSEKLFTEEAREALKKSEVLIGAGRVLESCKTICHAPVFVSYKNEEILSFLREHEAYKTAAIVYSGDIGFYSGAKGMRKLLSEFEVEAVSGIASPVYFLNKLGVSWEDTRLVSCHGQEVNLLPLIKREKKVCALLGRKGQTKQFCRELLECNMGEVRLTVGERLSYAEERIVSGTAQELMEEEFDSLSVVLFENDKAEIRQSGGIADDLFLRGKAPMTKEEIRTLSLSKLRLTEDAVVYDIGAGTGSAAIEAALRCERGQVYAVERKAEAIELLRENRKRFGAGNLQIIEGEAPDCLKELPAPTHVFIGGSGGKLLDIIEAVRQKNEKARFVLNAVTLETIALLGEIRERFPEYDGMEVLWVNVAKSRNMARYRFMTAENPILIAGFGGEDKE